MSIVRAWSARVYEWLLLVLLFLLDNIGYNDDAVVGHGDDDPNPNDGIIGRPAAAAAAVDWGISHTVGLALGTELFRGWV